MINLYKKHHPISKETVIERIKMTNEVMKRNPESYINLINYHKEELDFISQNLGKMRYEMDQLANEEIIYIFKKTNIKIDNEEMILNIIKTRLQKINEMNDIRENRLKRRRERKELIQCIHSQNLTRKSLKEYINMIEEEDIKGETWKELKKTIH